MKISKIFTGAMIVMSAIALTSCSEVKRGEYASGTAAVFCDDGFKNILDEAYISGKNLNAVWVFVKIWH